MGHHCPVCHKAAHKRCIEKGHLKFCAQHNTIDGNLRQCVNCYQALRNSKNAKSNPEDLSSDTTPEPQRLLPMVPKQPPGKSLKPKKPSKFQKESKKREEEATQSYRGADDGMDGESKQKPPAPKPKPVEQNAKEDKDWFKRYRPNTDVSLKPRQMGHHKRSLVANLPKTVRK